MGRNKLSNYKWVKPTVSKRERKMEGRRRVGERGRWKERKEYKLEDIAQLAECL